MPTRVLELTEERALRLERIVAQCGLTEQEVIDRALDALLRPSGEDGARGWAALAAPAFEAVWDNDSDSSYDRWRELYDVPQR